MTEPKCPHGPDVLCMCKLEEAKNRVMESAGLPPAHTFGIAPPDMIDRLRKQQQEFTKSIYPVVAPLDIIELPVIVDENLPPNQWYLMQLSEQVRDTMSISKEFFYERPRKTAQEVEFKNKIFQDDLAKVRMRFSFNLPPMRGILTGILAETSYRYIIPQILQHMIHRLGIMRVTLDTLYIPKRANGFANLVVSLLFGKESNGKTNQPAPQRRANRPLL